MVRHWPTLLLVTLIAALQYPLWLGKGGWLQAWEAERALEAQRTLNTRLEARNVALEADVKDLKTGFDAVEERARIELGLVKPGEAFVQVPRSSKP
ncbi:cell division protein FtsB [Methyloversatilis universalis]|jgi:cell division protein FtsB|uniref:cell division protein FtsB n=1 Tax=Methyloversatilis universalis TaxID=378211 RepID=UPI000372F99B|nr:cell division protein FtsB [Methyloversatilis universalis]